MNSVFFNNFIIYTIVYAIIILCVGSLSNFLVHSFKKGMIFDSYLPFLGNTLLKIVKVDRTQMKAICDQTDNCDQCLEEMNFEMVITHPLLSRLYKPLGGCGICMNMWLSFFVFALSVFVINTSWWLLLPFSLLCHFSFMLIFKVNN